MINIALAILYIKEQKKNSDHLYKEPCVNTKSTNTIYQIYPNLFVSSFDTNHDININIDIGTCMDMDADLIKNYEITHFVTGRCISDDRCLRYFKYNHSSVDVDDTKTKKYGINQIRLCSSNKDFDILNISKWMSSVLTSPQNKICFLRSNDNLAFVVGHVMLSKKQKYLRSLDYVMSIITDVKLDKYYEDQLKTLESNHDL
jgi:hypothetical protein